jgi:putative redox protein
MPVEIHIDYPGRLLCIATHAPSGETLTTDAPPASGGRGETFSPTDLVAAALGTCVTTVVSLIALDWGLDLAGTQVRVIKEMAPDAPRRIAAIQVRVTLPPGAKLPAEVRTAFEREAAQCPVRQSLHPSIRVGVEFVYPN